MGTTARGRSPPARQTRPTDVLHTAAARPGRRSAPRPRAHPRRVRALLVAAAAALARRLPQGSGRRRSCSALDGPLGAAREATICRAVEVLLDTFIRGEAASAPQAADASETARGAGPSRTGRRSSAPRSAPYPMGSPLAWGPKGRASRRASVGSVASTGSGVLARAPRPVRRRLLLVIDGLRRRDVGGPLCRRPARDGRGARSGRGCAEAPPPQLCDARPCHDAAAGAGAGRTHDGVGGRGEDAEGAGDRAGSPRRGGGMGSPGAAGGAEHQRPGAPGAPCGGPTLPLLPQLLQRPHLTRGAGGTTGRTGCTARRRRSGSSPRPCLTACRWC